MQGDSLNLRYSKTTIPMLENQVTAFACLPRGGAVLGTTAGNIGMIKNDTFHMYSRLKYQLPSSAVTVLYPGKDNSFWIGSGSFLIKFDDGIKQTFTYGKPGGLPLPSVTAALPRDDGNVWLMGSNNLVLFDNTSDWDLAAPQHKFPYATTNSNFSALRSMCRDSHGAIWMECGDALIKYTPSPMIHVDARRMRCTDKEGSAVDRIVFQKPTGFSTRVTLAGPADVTVQSFLVNGKRIGESKSTFAQAGDYFLSIPFRKKSDILHNVVIVKVRIVAK
jgi:ligand-binding sensor domain-containing protein